MTGAPDPARERTKQVFRFLRAFAERNMPLRRRLDEHEWRLRLKDLPAHPTITVTPVRLASPGEDGSAAIESDALPLVRVRRPMLTRPPTPPSLLLNWLQPGWDNPEGSVGHLAQRNVVHEGETLAERFEDDPARVEALSDWMHVWKRWAEAEVPARKAMRVFEQLYDLYGRIERDSERVELMLGDGRLRWQRGQEHLDHPVLLQRVELEFDAKGAEFHIVDADRPTELFGALLQSAESLSPEELNKLRVELEDGGFHPLAEGETSSYLRGLVQRLGPQGTFKDELPPGPPGTQPVIGRDPVLFLRPRGSGLPAALDRVLQDLESGRPLPVSLTRLVGIEPAPSDDEPTRDYSPWSEPPDVLLSKPANLEQIQIARALERHRAVLVQGPPGTGKSHTIGNLIGHLVAHGKRVLVTSHTTKALRVLRGHVVETLRPLCVAVLENDLEGRTQMEAAVRGILSRLTLANEQSLEREVAALAEQRATILAEIEELTERLTLAREAEYRPIVVGADSTSPADAARWVTGNGKGNDWIPGPLEPGAPVPLSDADLALLYETQGKLTAEEEAELLGGLPPLDAVPTFTKFATCVAALSATEVPGNEVFWSRRATAQEMERLSAAVNLITDASDRLQAMSLWQRALVAAGHSGEAERELRHALLREIEAANTRWEKCKPALIEHAPDLRSVLPADDLRRVVQELQVHVENGGGLGGFALLFKKQWKTVLAVARVNEQAPTKPAHFRALGQHVSLVEGRRKLEQRWKKQAEPIGLPVWQELGADPEPILVDYASQFEDLLGWWPRHWSSIDAALQAAGFDWSAFRQREVAHAPPTTPFKRDAAILSGPLRTIVSERLGLASRDGALEDLKRSSQKLESYRGPICSTVSRAIESRDVTGYESARTDLARLSSLSPLLGKRLALLDALAGPAPGWATAIRRREGTHGLSTLPGDVKLAWRWRQLLQEVDLRAALDEVALTKALHERRSVLQTTTAELIDRRAWLGQWRRTDLKAKQALQGWADTQKKIGKGTGKRAPALQAKARKLLAEARHAVPVWIMPLSRVAESFDATQGRFDVVIVDEASQSDPTGLLAWYLGERVAVVGDHEQVSPMAVGQELGAMTALIAQHLIGIPNSHLYDGTTSIYDLARQCFGGTIALREHFRCVPDIIEFSNTLSYNGEIRPLRDPSRVAVPHVVECVVDPSLGAARDGKTNLAEARLAAALIGAMCELPEYVAKTIGAITLLGDEQAHLIQDLLLGLVGAVRLDERRFVAGNAAQFQGDERHVMVLSMVDVPVGSPLALRQTETFKQRYNVAASRAKDQLWLIHSLDPDRDLKPGDLRRALVEHVRDPNAKQRAAQAAAAKAESPFEGAVIERLIAAGYRVTPQVWVGRYRIDMVVSDGSNQVALECDGDRYHTFAQIPADMARQAVLERAGWRFVRVRSTRFFREPEETMEMVTSELKRLGVRPVGAEPAAEQVLAQAREFKARVLRAAWDIMRKQEWVPTVPAS